MHFVWCFLIAVALSNPIRIESKSDGSSRVSRDSVIPLRIGLRQSNLENGRRHLEAISDPSSAAYGKHWSKEQVHNYFAPRSESVQAVTNWLISSGVPNQQISRTSNLGWIAVDLEAKQAEHLLKTTFYEASGPSEYHIRIHSAEHSLPEDIVPHVDYITPGLTPSAPLRKRKESASILRRSHRENPGVKWPVHRGTPMAEDLENCNRQITPDCLRALYNIPRGYLNDSVNALGIFEAQVYFTQEDLDLYNARFSSYVPNSTTPDVVVIGDAIRPPLSPNTNHSIVESTIDLDLATSLVYPQKITYYQVSPNFGNQTFRGGDGFVQASLNFLDAMDGSYCMPEEITAGSDCGTVEPARVISISYDTPEINQTAAFGTRQCNEFMKLALRGHTIIAASGDYGPGSVPPNIHSNGCISPDTKRLINNGTVFSPGYPQNCPYVLSVGGTQIDIDSKVSDPESALQVLGHAQELDYNNSYYASSGGFSNLFSAPPWQQQTLNAYFEKHNPGYPSYVSNWTMATGFGNETNIGENGGRYNIAGRGFPDVSGNGANFATYVALNLTLEYGTSLAAPLWASIFTLINEERTAIGKGPVGFVAPALYQNPQLFHDITNGSNPGCNTAGFSAVEGWDPITGLGTPNYPKLLDFFLSLP